MAEYIERETLTKVLNERKTEQYNSLKNAVYVEDTVTISNEIDELESVIEIAKEIPAADVAPVVRCKDCKYYTNNIHDPNLRDNFCNRVEQNCFDMRLPDGYCNYGERIDGDNK